jgi:predicted alpha-1,2-mannosidase
MNDSQTYAGVTSMVIVRLSLILTLLVPIYCYGQTDENLAPLAKVTGPGEEPCAAVDGVKQQDGSGEWIGGSPNLWFGWIHHPKGLELKWDAARKINKVVVYDRPTIEEHMAACTLTFSDGSRADVYAVPNDGSAKTVVFEPRTVTGMRLDVVDGVGEHIGLSEIEVYYDPNARPETRQKREFTDYVSYVDPTIETGRGRWFFCTPGSRPFGMICASAYTRNKNQGGGGYNYNSTEILGFANIHAWIMSGVNIMPVTGEMNPNLGEKHWKSGFSHETEIIEPGYHKVFLDRYKTQVEYTSTDRVAFYRLKYHEATRAKLLLQLGGFVGAASYVDGKAKLVGPTRIEGSHGMTDRLWGGPKLSYVFFVMEFDRPIARMDGWKGPEEQLHDIREFHNPLVKGRIQTGYYTAVKKYLFNNLPQEQAGVSLAYDVKKADEVRVKISISYTSIENARNNLRGECAHWNFDRVRTEARRQWSKWLGKIDVKGGDVNARVKFYTDLWHVLLGRHKIDDLSGHYPSYMGQPDAEGVVQLVVRSIPKDRDGKSRFHMYNSDALWLTMWNLNVLWGLGWPEMLDDFSASLMQYAATGGRLPRGPCAGGYSGIMTGCPATSLMAATYQKGIMTKVDPHAAFEQMKKDHMPGGAMKVDREYIDNGWSPGKAGQTIQWAFEDWALAQMAEKMGRRGDAEYFQKRSTGWRALVHPDIGLVLPRRADGSWVHTDPLKGQGWVEANAWQGTFGVSHDIAELASLMGGPDILAQMLNEAFEEERASDFVYTYGQGRISYANQPGCSNAHVFNHAGYPWLSQYWVRRVSRQAYGGTNPNVGYGGHDEDQGQMGGVSALMKLGLFSLRGTCSRNPIYEITAPEFDEITITLDPHYYSGREFRIRTHDNSTENCYIQKAELNGKPLNSCWFYHKDFAEGGLLELWLGPKPNTQWGSSPIRHSHNEVSDAPIADLTAGDTNDRNKLYTEIEMTPRAGIRQL